VTSSKIGTDIQTGQIVEIPKPSRLRGLYIIGAPGTGKSGLIENLIIQDIVQDIGVCLLDPHGDLTQAVLARLPDRRVKDVILLDIADYHYPFGLNLFACSDLTNPRELQQTIDQVMHVFDKLFDVDRSTPLLAEYLRNCTHTLVVNPGYTMADIPLLLLNEQCRRKLVPNVMDTDVKLFWQQYDDKKPSERSEEASSTLRRVREFLQPLSRLIVGQASTIDMRSVMDERKILLVKLDPRLEMVTSLVGSVIIALFLNAAYSRADLPLEKRKQFNLYADEFQRFATEDFAILFTEARKFGIALTVAHQMREQLDRQNRSATVNVANLVVFKVSSPDADELAGEFDCTPPPAEPRREAVQVVTQKPVEQLLRYGHKDEAVKNFFVNYLQRISNNIDAMTDDTLYILKISDPRFGDEHEYICKRAHLIEGLQKINTFFVKMMEDSLAKDDPIFDEMRKHILEVDFNEEAYKERYREAIYEHIYDIIVPLRSFLGFAADAALRSKEYYLRKDLFNEFESEWYEEELDARTKLAYMIYCKKKQWFFPEHKLYLNKEDDQTFQVSLGDGYKYKYPDYLTNKHNYLFKELIAVRYEYARSQLKDEVLREREKNGIHELLLARAHREVDAIVAFTQCIFNAANTLADNPIMVDSGQYKDVPGVQRTYQDMQNEIASKMVKLDQYMARVKIASDGKTVEHIIQTLNPKKESRLADATLNKRITDIQTQNLQDEYVRERIEVEEEIRQRQEQCSKPPGSGVFLEPSPEPPGSPRRKKIT